MGDKTKILWSGRTWNPTTGCTKVSAGCDHCYAETIATRFAGTAAFPHGFDVQVRKDKVNDPLRWRKTGLTFVNSMSDLFHDEVPEPWLADIWAVMAAAQKQTFQVLTKRHGRMRSLLTSDAFIENVRSRALGKGLAADAWTWPLPNIWVGVSVEDQQWADIRIPVLLETPAAVRFLSCEPLLGPIDLFGPRDRYGFRSKLTYWLDGRPGWGNEYTTPTGLTMSSPVTGPHIDWVICGGESGRSARPMHPDWARQLRDQCAHSGVPYFFKQWGEWGPMAPIKANGSFDFSRSHTMADDGTLYKPGDLAYPDGPRYGEAIRADHHRAHLTSMYRLGTKHSGRELDGRTWDEFPKGASTHA